MSRCLNVEFRGVNNCVRVASTSVTDIRTLSLNTIANIRFQCSHFLCLLSRVTLKQCQAHDSIKPVYDGQNVIKLEILLYIRVAVGLESCKTAAIVRDETATAQTVYIDLFIVCLSGRLVVFYNTRVLLYILLLIHTLLILSFS